MLVVIGYANKKWLCRCDCGNEIAVYSHNLRSGSQDNCNCQTFSRQSRAKRKHGVANTPLYDVWRQMIRRCHDQSCESYQDYGARGILVCDRWRESPTHFIADMGPRPSVNHCIERIDNDGNYEPSNCTWATRSMQARNTRRTNLVTIDGRTQCLSDWAREFGVPRYRVTCRISRGWPAEEALRLPPGTQFFQEGDLRSKPAKRSEQT